MKTLLFTFVFVTIFVFGCVEQQSQITSPEGKNNPDKLSFLSLSGSNSTGLGVETVYSSSEWITGSTGGNIQLDVYQERPGNEYGNFVVHANVTVPPNSFPAGEQRQFTVSLDDQYALLDITPSPTTLYNQLIVDFYVQGIDVSGVTPENLGFVFISDNDDTYPTDNNSFYIDYVNNSITIEDAVIDSDSTILPGSRYGWVRKCD